MTDWDGEVLEQKNNTPQPLPAEAVNRLLRMTKVLQSNVNLYQVAEIKDAIRRGDIDEAKMLWSEFEEYEQVALWIAPSKGGVFTTEERKALHHGN